MSEIESVAKINFKIVDGVVPVENAEDIADDPVVIGCIKFLEKDMLANPPQLSVLQKDRVLENLLDGVWSEDFELEH